MVTQVCSKCGKSKKTTEYAKNKNTKTGIDLWCSRCRLDFVDTEEKLRDYCRENLRGYSEELLKSCLDNMTKKHKEQGIKDTEIILKKAIMQYFSKMNLFGQEGEKVVEKKEAKRETRKIKDSKLTESQFDVLEEKWGFGYTNQEYILFEKKYNRLIRSYNEKTELHSEHLLTYIRYRVKEELATAANQIKDAKEWGALAEKAAEMAKIKVTQMSKSDISGGIDVISQLFEAVESEVGIIPILPKVLEQPMDDADIIIWANVNFLRRLEEKPMISYREVWEFYDQMLKEYYEQMGYSEEEIKIYLEKRNNVFRDYGKIYVEPLYSQDLEEEIGEDDGEL